VRRTCPRDRKSRCQARRYGRRRRRLRRRAGRVSRTPDGGAGYDDDGRVESSQDRTLCSSATEKTI